MRSGRTTWPARRDRWLDIFYSPDLKLDNNHQLNTLWLYVLGDQHHWVVYRIPALVAGLLAVAVASAIGRHRSRAEGVFAAALGVAVSFMMVVYSTEARGYALVLLFALLAFIALRRYLDTPSVGAAAWFSLWIVLEACVPDVDRPLLSGCRALVRLPTARPVARPPCVLHMVPAQGGPCCGRPPCPLRGSRIPAAVLRGSGHLFGDQSLA